jgi:hypothetical protein
MSRASRLGALGCLLLAPLVVTDTASACGGCFHPPPSGPTSDYTVLSAHRMALAITPGETILWDQIAYEGSPEDFVWVLPVAGSPVVEVADNGFFEALSAAATLTLTGPVPACMLTPGMGLPTTEAPFAYESGPLATYTGRSPDDMTHADVLYQGVVGPYETVTIGSADPDALVNWLLDHAYQVPEETRPIIDAYSAMGMSFVVLRLRPDIDVQKMRPVRVRMSGTSPLLPLRMVAVGVGTTVDLELFVFAEGRMAASGFGNAEVDRSAIAFDWATGRFDYAARFDDALFAGASGTTNWVTELAGPAPEALLTSYRATGPLGDVHEAAADYAIASAGLTSPYLTRLRTRLTRAELDRDLVLVASDAGDVGTSITVSETLNEICLDAGAGGDAGPLVGFDAGPRMRDDRRSCVCSASRGGEAPWTLLALGLAALRARRRGRRR